MAGSTQHPEENVPSMLNNLIERIQDLINVENSANIVEGSCHSNEKPAEVRNDSNVEEQEIPLTIDVDKLQEDILQYYNNSENSISDIKCISNPTNSIIRSSSKEATPIDLIRKIKQASPDVEISDAFFELCAVAACTGRKEMMKYIHDAMRNESFYHKLNEYLKTYFYSNRNENIKFGPLRTIGHLLLCGVPDCYCYAISPYREKLQARNMFDADMVNCELSVFQRRILLDYFVQGNFSRENAKVCGFIMCQFMIGYINNKKLPSIDFLTDHTTALTEEEKKIVYLWQL